MMEDIYTNSYFCKVKDEYTSYCRLKDVYTTSRKQELKQVAHLRVLPSY